MQQDLFAAEDPSLRYTLMATNREGRGGPGQFDTVLSGYVTLVQSSSPHSPERILSRRIRCNHNPVFKANLALAALTGALTTPEVAKQFAVPPTQIAQWKAQLLEHAPGAVDEKRHETPPAVDINTLHAKIGQRTLENDFLEGALGKAGLLSVKP